MRKLPKDISDAIFAAMQAQRDLSISGYKRDHAADDQAYCGFAAESEQNVNKNLDALIALGNVILKHIKP